MFSSANGEYGTPDWVFKPVAEALGLNFDAAASHENHKLPTYATDHGLFVKNFTTPHKLRGVDDNTDGLSCSWAKRRVWCNPPFGKGIVDWVRKAATETEHGCPVAALLLPARTETDWFQRWVFPYAEVHFVMGRIHFIGGASSAPFPTVIAVYAPEIKVPQGQVFGYTCDLKSGDFTSTLIKGKQHSGWRKTF